MSFSLSPSMASNKVFMIRQNKLEGRLDPFCYIPDLVQLDESVKSKTDLTLRDFTLSKSSGATPRKEDASNYSDDENGIPFIRVQNLSTTGKLDLNDLVYISKDVHEGLLKRSQIKEGDLLVKITGVGRMAVASVVPVGFEGNINQHIVAIRTGSKEVSENLAAFLNLDITEQLASKRATGATRPALDYPALLSIPVKNERGIFLTIHQAVKEKQKKEKQAQQLIESIDDYLLEALGIEKPLEEENDLQSRVFYRHLSEISGWRYDPSAFHRERLSAVRNVNASHYPLKKFREVVQMKKNLVDSIGEARYLGLENVESDTGNYVDGAEKGSISSAFAFGKGDVLFPKLRPYLNKVFHAPFDGICSTEFHVLTSQTLNSDYLACFLRSIIIVMQTQHLMTGNTLPRLQVEDIQKLEIPVPPPEKQKEIAAHTQEIRFEAEKLKQEAQEGLEQAKREVEAMILGEAA